MNKYYTFKIKERGSGKKYAAKRKYQKKCKQRIITFYLKDKEIYEFSKTINFQEYVKTCLRVQLAFEKALQEDNIREA